METALLAVDDPRWHDVLRMIPHDFYQFPEYLRFAVRHEEEGEPMAFLAQNADDYLLIPFVERPIPDTHGRPTGFADVITVRGYAGPLVSDSADMAPEGFVDRALRGFVHEVGERSVVTAYIRLHPLLSPPVQTLERHGEVVDHGASISLDLGLPLDELRRRIRGNHRRDIRRTIALGYRTRADEEWEHFDAFVRAYDIAMVRLGATAAYRLDEAYFMDLRAALGDHLHLYVAELDGEFANGTMLTETDGIVEYHFAATAPEHTNASPSKLIINDATEWAQLRGARTFHLAGSPAADDSLYRFKYGFSRESHRVRSWRITVDEAANRSLVAQWYERQAPGFEPADGFFPPYRSPAVPATATHEEGSS